MKNCEKRCDLCGGSLAFGEVYFAFGRRALCCDCADGITEEDLMHVTGAKNERALLVALGFEKEVII